MFGLVPWRSLICWVKNRGTILVTFRLPCMLHIPDMTRNAKYFAYNFVSAVTAETAPSLKLVVATSRWDVHQHSTELSL